MLLLLLVTLSSAPAPDPCTGVLPPAVLAAVGKAYPGFRVARGSDYSTEDLGWSKDDVHPCPGIASNDVDGDGTTDFAFFLLSEKGDAFLASARVPGGAKVRIDNLMSFGSRGLGRSFVYPLDPGKYADMYSCLRNLGARHFVSSVWTCRPDETLDRSTTGRWRRCAGSLFGE